MFPVVGPTRCSRSAFYSLADPTRDCAEHRVLEQSRPAEAGVQRLSVPKSRLTKEEAKYNRRLVVEAPPEAYYVLQYPITATAVLDISHSSSSASSAS